MIADDWRDLCETVRDAAEGYAATDPAHAWAYRQEAARFGQSEPPGDAEELARREADALTLRRRWSLRFRRGGA